MSSRWSYGPEGLRERPTKRWSEAELLPRWRELQPLLIRSAGVVGIVATIMAIVSSDALRFGGEIPGLGRNDRAALPDASEGGTTSPVVAAASELPSAGARQASGTAAPTQAAALDLAEASAPSVAPTPAIPPVQDLRKEGAPGAPTATIASLQLASAAPAAGALLVSAPASAIADLRTDRQAAAPGASGPETTASVPAALDGSAGAPAAPAADDASVWREAAAACPRDWIAGGAAPASAGGADCPATTELVASIAEDDRSALEEAAAQRAESLGMLAPRIPVPRPAVVPPPAAKPIRVSRASSSWPAAPPPNCGAGQHAKWRFVNHKAGTKEWYCR